MPLIEFLKEVGLSGLIDIAFMSVLVYTLLIWFKRTRAAFVLTGIIIIAAVYLLARQFNLALTAFVLQGFFAVILVALVVIFQEELRHFFEQIAVWSLNRNVGRRRLRNPGHETEVLVRTLTDLADDHIGALIVLKGKTPIIRHLHGGIDLNGELSEPLLRSLFDPHSPGHEGALVIHHDRVVEYSCHLPLSKNFQQLKMSGTRHAAALGLSELTDALCLVVSEEQGSISYARHGKISKIENADKLSALIDDFYREIRPQAASRVSDISLFSKNYVEKILAIMMTLALWFVLVYESRPIKHQVEVPVLYRGVSSPYSVAGVEPKAVRVTLFGPRRGFHGIQKTLRLNVHVVERAGSQSRRIYPSDFSTPKDLEIDAIEPNSVTFEIENSQLD